jgi:hypothetical protein
MLLQPQRHLALAHRLDNPLLGSVLAEQFQRPPHVAFGRFAAGEGDDLLLLSRRKARRGTAPWRVVQSALYAYGAEPLTYTADRPLPAANVLDNLLVGETFVGFEQDQRPSNHAHRSRARLHQLL